MIYIITIQILDSEYLLYHFANLNKEIPLFHQVTIAEHLLNGSCSTLRLSHRPENMLKLSSVITQVQVR
ncbi:hypothetical protein K0M31_007202 [Melipona bicolor]|uniref:Uncharacterized protein n=1 Tax=Melipona bicolor TaxID=60889 RepID=A0AA40GB64_9HYME|nr:hypothetical protein K0M31_007202 [Melipona bicolor]